MTRLKDARNTTEHAAKRRKAMLHLAEATLARYERVRARGRAHPPDFNALMMRICARIVEETPGGPAVSDGREEMFGDAINDDEMFAGIDTAPIRQTRRGTR